MWGTYVCHHNPEASFQGARTQHRLGMSWQAYVDTQLIASGYVHEAAIVGKTDCNPWGGTPDFLPRKYRAVVTADDMTEQEVVVNEAEDIVSFASTGNVPKTGFRFNGQKYRLLKVMKDKDAEPYGLVVAYGKGNGGGITLVATQQLIIIATYNSRKDPAHCGSNCNVTCENLGKFLMERQF